MKVSEKRPNRQEANRKLVGILKTLVEQYPDMRFAQILTSCDFIIRENASHWTNDYYMESVDLEERVVKALAKLPGA